uniref:Uncharacterized protein n=1 Tax=Sinocyclocheilus rhinocerous TaxID=307959 RepID=A0A673HLD4_9TELE
PYCSRTVIRRVDMERHLVLCYNQLTSQSMEPVLPRATPSAEPVLPRATPPHARQLVQGAAEVYGKSVRCPHCNLSLLKKNYNTHLLRRHADLSHDIIQACHLQSVTVDERNGIFAVQKTGHGFSMPVHVQRKTWGKIHQVRCELEECVQYQLLAQRSGLSYSLCSHIRSVDYCRETAAETFLGEDTLRDMMAFKFFGEAKAANSVKRQKAACAARVPLCVPVDFGGSPSQICLSIHEPNIHRFCQLGRIMVTYNTQRNTWHCPCTKPRTSCPQIHISKWHLFQTQRDLFKSEVPTTPSSEGCSLLDTTGMKRSVQYIFKEKKIPEALPKEVTTPRMKMEYPKQFFPLETTCQLCTGHPELAEAVLVTKKARIVSMMGLIDNISTYHRICPQCNMVYRYQEWKDGLHNFDNHIFLTLELCVLLDNGNNNMICHCLDVIFHAYCHFEALTDTEYTYSCVNCGFYPPVVVMDLHRKGVFKLAGNIKFNLRAESPRDFADLLSWKHFPNVCVYDFARGLATHINLRFPHSLPFQPHEGRLSEPTEENVKAAMDGKLQVSLPWLHERRVHCGEENAHPVTGSSEHYVLYDRFHEKNATDPKDILRRVQLVPELKGWLNSQVAEQFFAKIRKSNYFNNMAPSTHVFLMRSVIHRHNTSTNRALLERQLNSGRRLELLSTITLSALGLFCNYTPSKDHKGFTGWRSGHDILQRILVFVVLEDGCSAILRLALTCQRFNNIVSQEHFQQEAHFSWLDSEFNKCGCPLLFFVGITISQLYKDCGAGYQGNGKQGLLLWFYSSDDHPGYCSWDCFTDDGGLEE